MKDTIFKNLKSNIIGNQQPKVVTKTLDDYNINVSMIHNLVDIGTDFDCLNEIAIQVNDTVFAQSETKYHLRNKKYACVSEQFSNVIKQIAEGKLTDTIIVVDVPVDELLTKLSQIINHAVTLVYNAHLTKVYLQ